MSDEDFNENVSERAEALLNKGKDMSQEEFLELRKYSSNKLYADRIAKLMSEVGNKLPEGKKEEQATKDEKSSENAVGANVGEFVRPQRMWKDRKIDFREIGNGFVRDMTDLTKTPFQMAKDVYEFGKMVAQGKTRDAVGKAANKIYANLKGMIGLESENESKLYGINKFANRTVKQALKPYKQMGRDVKALFQRLSGCTGVSAVASVAKSGSSKDYSR